MGDADATVECGKEEKLAGTRNKGCWYGLRLQAPDACKPEGNDLGCLPVEDIAKSKSYDTKIYVHEQKACDNGEAICGISTKVNSGGFIINVAFQCCKVATWMFSQTPQKYIECVSEIQWLGVFNLISILLY